MVSPGTALRGEVWVCALPQPIGPHPVLVLTVNRIAEPLASVAVLTSSRILSETYYRGLANSEVPRLRLVLAQDFTFTPGIEVTEIEQVKGLEFDYVVLVEVSASNFPDQPSSRRLLHVAVTRAVHQLWLTSVATPSPLLRGI